MASISEEISDKYETLDNAFRLVVKDDPKDRLEVEIGDEKQPDTFYPQVKIKRIAWNKGMAGHITEETREKMRKAKLGRKLSEEHKKKISKALKGREPANLSTLDNSGANSHWWKGGITSENERQRKTKEFRNWRKAVYEKDGYKCQRCKKNTRNLHPHHILNFAEHENLRFRVTNGITFCESCHRRFHSVYGMIGNNEKQLKEYLCQ